MPYHTRDARSSPVALALLRHGLMLLIWLARYRIQVYLGGPPALATIALDAILLTLYLRWVNVPLQRSMRAEFGERANLSWHLVTPVVIAAFFLVRDILFAVRGTPL